MNLALATSKTHPAGRRGGFTLLELLVVIAILGIVSGLGTSAFVTVTSAWNERKSITELDAQAQQAFKRIRRDLSDTLSYELSGIAIRGTRHDAVDTSTVPAAHNADDDIAIPVQGVPVQGASAGRARQRAALVGYRMDRGAGEGSLVQTAGDLDAEFPTTGKLEIIPGAHTVAFRVEYLSSDPDSLWVGDWKGPGHPGAVRISLTLEDPDRPAFQISRKAVFRVHVQ